ncbi:MAG: DUF6600 domain-containing protein [Bacteroidota bacterium]|jgi:hypothetical protein
MRSLKIFALLVALNMGVWITSHEASAQQGSVSFWVFYDELSPYGQWVDYPGYGYVWIPSTGSDFAPYSTNGHWIWTEYGWTWVSDYSWGWAPFHYGRWDYDDSYGWFWVPDNEWGPSWVNWRRADGYYGWSPMRPGISLSVSFGSGYTVPNDRWRFVRDRDFSRTDINHYYVNRTNNSTIIKNSSVINRTYTDQNRHTTYISGPDRADVQKITGRTVQPVVIHDNEKPGQNLKNGQLQIYRPQVQMNDKNGGRPVPSKVVNLKDVKRPSERNATNPTPNVKPVIQKKQPVQPSKINPVKNSNNKNRPVQQHNVIPSKNKVKKQLSRSVNPPKKVQPLQPRVVNPSNSSRNAKQPQKVTPRNENVEPRSSQPKTNEGEKEQRK